MSLDKKREKPLVDFFKGRWENVPAGVCSLRAGGEVWIVCPRRLFTLERGASATDHEQFSANILKHQVWARMVSQLIVKSQIGKAWGGATLWILQDALTNYISRTTDLNLQKLISATIKEVNILSLAYSEQRNSDGTIALKNDHLFAGVIPPITGDTDFNKLLQAANIPPKQELERKLLSKKPRAKLSVK